MTPSDRFERRFVDVLVDLAEPEFPEYFDHVLETAMTHSQRPAWTFPERWLPMDVLTRRLILAPQVPWRTVGLLVALALLVAAAVVVVGSQRRVAPPFGPARNGLLAYSVEGDIYARDPIGGTSRAIVSGPSVNLGPAFSPDGTLLAFVTVVAPDREMLMVSNVDGTAVRPLTDARDRLSWWDWSPDGSRLAFVSNVDEVPTIGIVNIDGKTQPRVLDVGMPADLVVWRPPDGSELIFRGSREASVSGIFAVNPDGGTPRPLTPTDGHIRFGYMGPFGLSPDGVQLSYTEWEDLAVLRVHVLNLDTGEDQTRMGRQEEGSAFFSPDGRSIVFNRRERSRSTSSPAGIYVGPVSDPDRAVRVGPETTSDDTGDIGVGYAFSPDGTKIVIANYRTSELRIADVTGGEGTVVDDIGELPTWQRLAP